MWLSRETPSLGTTYCNPHVDPDCTSGSTSWSTSLETPDVMFYGNFGVTEFYRQFSCLSLRRLYTVGCLIFTDIMNNSTAPWRLLSACGRQWQFWGVPRSGQGHPWKLIRHHYGHIRLLTVLLASTNVTWGAFSFSIMDWDKLFATHYHPYYPPDVTTSHPIIKARVFCKTHHMQCHVPFEYDGLYNTACCKQPNFESLYDNCVDACMCQTEFTTSVVGWRTVENVKELFWGGRRSYVQCTISNYHGRY